MDASPRKTSRRSLLRDSSSAGAGLLALSSMTASSFAVVSGANDRVRIGVIGTGGRAIAVDGPPDPQAAGCCSRRNSAMEDEARGRRRPGGRGRRLRAPSQPRPPPRPVRKRPSSTTTASSWNKRMCDAVIIAAPDHWHKQMLIDAVAAGKDVYVEKPVTHALEEGPEEIQAVEKSGRIVQTGTQQRSWPHYVQGKQIVASGALGVVRLVEAFWFMNYGVRRRRIISREAGASGQSRLEGLAGIGARPAVQSDEIPGVAAVLGFWRRQSRRLDDPCDRDRSLVYGVRHAGRAPSASATLTTGRSSARIT